MKKHVFILNPKAGFCKIDEWKDLILKKFKDKAEIRVTEYAGHATEIAKEYEDSYLYAVGGDGTANEAMCGTVGSSNALCILPAGSGNDFVRTIYKKIKSKQRTVKGILERVDSFSEKVIDCARANNSFFMNIASVGFDAEVVKNSEKFENLPFMRKISYILAIFYTIFNYKGIDLEGEIDGVPFKQKSLLLCIANGIYYGGGLPIAPSAVLEDGKLDVYLIESVRPLTFLTILPRLANGSHVKVKYVKHFRAEKISIWGKDLMLNLDGELIPTNRADIEIIPGGLTILAPPQ